MKVQFYIFSISRNNIVLFLFNKVAFKFVTGLVCSAVSAVQCKQYQKHPVKLPSVVSSLNASDMADVHCKNWYAKKKKKLNITCVKWILFPYSIHTMCHFG